MTTAATDLEPLPRRRWSEAPWQGLQRLLAGPPGMLAMDWDETATRGDISYLLLADLDERQPGLWAQHQEQIARDRVAGYRALAALIQAGRTPAEIGAWTRSVAQRAREGDAFRWVPEVRDLIHALTSRGWSVWVVTGSPTPVVAALCPEYGIPPEQVIGMEAHMGASGLYLDELVEPVTWREGKVLRLEQRARQLPTLAMGDSEGDVRLLASASHAIWIDHGDPTLRAAANSAGWWRQEGW